MKYVFLAFFVFFASLPLQATSCDMHENQGTSFNQHGDKQHDNMPDMDCCDHDPSIPSDNCESQSTCGAGTATVVAINPATSNTVFVSGCRQYLSDSGKIQSRFSSPPFRPPIA